MERLPPTHDCPKDPAVQNPTNLTRRGFLRCAVAGAASVGLGMRAPSAWAAGNPGPVRLMLTTDLHYLTPRLLEAKGFLDGTAVEGTIMTRYLDPVIDALVDDVIAQKPDAFLCLGDLAFDGETPSHENWSPNLHAFRTRASQCWRFPETTISTPAAPTARVPRPPRSPSSTTPLGARGRARATQRRSATNGRCATTCAFSWWTATPWRTPVRCLTRPSPGSRSAWPKHRQTERGWLRAPTRCSGRASTTASRSKTPLSCSNSTHATAWQPTFRAMCTCRAWLNRRPA